MNHVIGDSNCIYTFYGLPGFVSDHLGSVRMRDVAEKGRDLLNIGKLDVKPGDQCFLCFGEIDVRCDLNRACFPVDHLAETIEGLVAGYMRVVRENVTADVTLWIVSVLPPAYRELQPPDIRDHPVFPFVGADCSRATYTMMLNGELWRETARAGFRWLDLHQRYRDAAYMLRPELASKMHVSDTTPALEELTALGMLPVDAKANPSMAHILHRFGEVR